jgi:hypothetical protein
VLLGGCDVATPDPPRATGPGVHVVGSYPPDGCGVGPDPDCLPVPTNASIKLRVDRFLDPATINRQAIQVYTGDPDFSPGITFQVVYDPVERVVELRVPRGQAFKPQTLYQVVLNVPKDEGDFGLRAFDGAPLTEAELPLHSSFFTGTAPVEHPDEDVPTCQTVLTEVLGQPLGNCAGSACHASANNRLGDSILAGPPYGLSLDGPEPFMRTAVRRVAHETELGDESGGIPAERSSRFGVRMPLIDPHNPGNSYLLYKLLMRPENFEPCPPGAEQPVCLHDPTADPGLSSHTDLPLSPGETSVPSAEELLRLREWFVRGEPMPLLQYIEGAPIQGNVRLQGLRALAQFIAAGADCSASQRERARDETVLRGRGAAVPAISVDSL